MNRFNYFIKLSWTFLVALTLTLGLAGCEGDDGAAGAAGAAGAPGADGSDGTDGLACWDLNGNGVGDPEEDTNGDSVFDAADCQPAVAKVTPLESCEVCHDVGSIADAGAAHALPPIEAVSNVAFAAVGADLAVTFDLSDAGVPLTSYDEVMRAYVNNGGTVTDYRDVATMANNGGGNYTITIAGAAAEALVNNRWLFRIRDSVAEAANNSEVRTYFYADFPDNPFAAEDPLVVGGDACAACHGPEGIRVHGSHFIASDGGEPCLTCHGAADGRFGAVPALAVVAHEYHSGLRDEITYPTYMNNCSVCHSEPAQLTAANSMLVEADACFTCHGSTAGIPFEEGSAAEALHVNVVDTCNQCHAGQIANIPQTVADAHNGAITERDGVIWNGEDTSVTEGAKVDWRITGVTDDGTDLAITWEASYDGIAFSPCNADPAAGPVFFADADPAATPPVDNGDNLSILRNYAQGEDFILGTRTDRPQPGSTPGVSAANTTCDSGGVGFVATTVVPVEATDAMYGRVAIQGKPRVLNVDPTPDPDFADEYGPTMPVRAKTPTYDWTIGDGSAAPPRRAVADTSLCLNCHVGSLYQHGGNRVDNIDMCMLCHNAAANEQYVRAGYGVDASEAYDGRAGQAFGIKEMVHAVHPAGATGNPIVIYRGRGIYAWADDVSKLSNWPAGDWPGDIRGLPIFGSDDGTGNAVLQTHHFHTPTYPRGLYDCAACHVAELNILPDPTKAMATTVESGQPPFAVNENDVLQGVQTTSCITCHADSATKGHAYQNSWTPQVFPEGRQTIIDAN